MKRRVVLELLTGGAAGVALSGCWPLGPAHLTYRYRLTVEVDTPQGLRSGSAVREVTVNNPMGLGQYAKVRGEAVAVDLPNGKTLFALLPRSPDFDYLAPATIRPQGTYHGDDPVSAVREAMSNRTIVEVPREISRPDTGTIGWPTFVAFRDIDDPASKENVDPDKPAAKLGGGYAIRRLTIQFTDDPVTRQIHERLRWLGRPEMARHRKAHSSPGGFSTGSLE